MESAARAVEVLCFGEMGNVLNSPRPLDVARLIDRRVILELDALNRFLQYLFSGPPSLSSARG